MRWRCRPNSRRARRRSLSRSRRKSRRWRITRRTSSCWRTRTASSSNFARIRAGRFGCLTKLLEDKNRIIEQLRKNQGGPVRLLDYLSQSMDPLKVWLTNVDGDKEIALTGKALTNDDIVEFIRNLQQSGYFAGVLLEESRQTAEEGLIIYSFRIKMAVKA